MKPGVLAVVVALAACGPKEPPQSPQTAAGSGEPERPTCDKLVDHAFEIEIDSVGLSNDQRLAMRRNFTKTRERRLDECMHTDLPIARRQCIMRAKTLTQEYACFKS